MKTACRILFGMLIVCNLLGCSDDGDVDEPKDSSSSSVQVTVLFEPGQVGDRGYADHIMSCIPQIGKLQTADKSSIDAQFLAYNSQRETLEGLRQWSLQRENPFFGGSYQRRLLVLTDAQQASLLDSIQIDETQDEVLMLNTPSSMVDSLSEARWGSHVHALNISINKEMKQLGHFITKVATDSLLSPRLFIFRKHNESYVADSASMAIASLLQPSIEMFHASLDSLKKDATTGEDNFAQGVKWAYDLAIFYYALLPYDTQHLYFFVQDGGVYNLGFLAVGAVEGLMPVTYLDTDVEDNAFQFSIKRHYSQALVDWISQWVSSKPAESLPRVLWHGSWDGYVDSTIPDVK